MHCGPIRHRHSAVIVSIVCLVASHLGADEQTPAAGNLSGSLVFDTDREAGNLFESARDEIARGQTTAGLQHLQQLLDRPDEVLIEVAGTIRSAREAVNSIIAQLPAADRAAYERLVHSPARRDFDAARNPIDRDALLRLRDRYRHASIGRQAAILLAALAYDRGETSAAESAAQFLMQHYPAAELPAGIARRTSPAVATNTSTLTAGTSTATGTVGPAWSHDLQLAEGTARAIDRAVSELDAQAMLPTLTARPLVVDGRIVTRTLRGLLCVDAATGQRLWQQPVDSHVGRLADRPGTLRDPIRTGSIAAALLRRLVRDSLQDELTTDGRQVFTLFTGDPLKEPDPRQPANRLRAVDIATGETVWELGFAESKPPRQRGNAGTELAPRFFLGPPLVDGDQLLLPAQREQSVELVALDRHTGTVMWTVTIGRAVRDLFPGEGTGAETPPEDRERQSTACRLTRRGTQVLCPTGVGAIACIDTSLRRLVWARRYPRRDLSARAPQQGDGTYFRELPVRDAFTTAQSWIVGDVGLCLAPDADRLLAISMSDGRRLWSRPRGQAIQVLPADEQRFLVVEATGVRALRTIDGTQTWWTPTPRPVGQATLYEQQLLLPVAGNRIERIRWHDGVRVFSAESDHDADALTVKAHAPTGLRPIALRNLLSTHGILLSQSTTGLRRIDLSESAQTAKPTPVPLWKSSLISHLEQAMRYRATFAAAIELLRQIDSRLLLMDGVLLRLFEQWGLKPSRQQQASRLLTRWQRADADDNRQDAEQAKGQLLDLGGDTMYVTTADGRHSCRLDRWLQPRPSVPPAPAPQAQNPATDQTSPPIWPDVTPRVTEQASRLGISYLHRVPVDHDRNSAWQAVTIEADRQGKMIQFSAPQQDRPSLVLLPREVGSYRLEPRFLQGWARGRMLLIRVGMELIAFEHPGGDTLPAVPVWPEDGRTLSLLGSRAGLPAVLLEQPQTALPPWDATSAGFEDVFGRGLGDVGPVCAEHFCHLQRGDVIARDTRSGRELWRRTRWPVGTRAIGDDQTVVLFHPERPLVTVLDADDGRKLREWSVDPTSDRLTASAPRPFVPHLIAGTRALFTRTEGERLQLLALDMTTGESLWNRDIPTAALPFAVDERQLGLVAPAGPPRAFSLSLLDWSSGASRPIDDVDGPDELREVLTLTDATRRYVILSGPITDLPLQNVRQIRGGLDRPVVNGWLVALDRVSAAGLWSTPLKNVAFPLVQPRHVPLLVINDMVQPAGRPTPNGRLTCLDARTGKWLLSVTEPTHAYYTLEPAVQQSRIDLHLRRRTFRIDYSEDEPDSDPAPEENRETPDQE